MKYLSKFPGLIAIALGIFIGIGYFYLKSETSLISGLFFLFVLKEGKEDERAITIRSSSAFIALGLSYIIKLIIEMLYTEQIIDFKLDLTNHFLIVLFALANIIRYIRQYFTS